MKQVWLIRHGESEANAGGKTSDPALVPLTSSGERQAMEIVPAFTQKPSLIILSRYLRARQTAKPVLDQFSGVLCEDWDVHEFTYLSPDRCLSTTILERKPLVESFWKKCDPHYCDGRGAESFVEFIERVQATITSLKRHESSFCAIFSHMQFIAAMLWCLESPSRVIDSEAMKDYKLFLERNPIANGSITKLQLMCDV